MTRVINDEEIIGSVVFLYEGAHIGTHLLLGFRSDIKFDGFGDEVESVAEDGT